MKLSAPVPLERKHSLAGFSCGKPSLDVWFSRIALQAQAGGSAKTFVVLDGTRIAGYFSLTVGHVESLDAPERIRKGMGSHSIPVVILARMAVDSHYQGKGIGRGMLQDAIRRALVIAEQAGIRALLTHPIDQNAERFYARFGFVPFPIREGQYLLLLKDARKV